MSGPLSPDACFRELGVSRETSDQLTAYVALLEKWQAKINLVGPKTMADVWRRHVLDSGQLFDLIPAEAKTILDLGSGAGFPGLVIALMGRDRGRPDFSVNLVESDQRKSVFLREVIRVTTAPAQVFAQRAEAIKLPAADVITARALAPLAELLAIASHFARPDTICIFPKGIDIESELTEASRYWKIAGLERVPSRTDPHATLLRLRGFTRV